MKKTHSAALLLSVAATFLFALRMTAADDTGNLVQDESTTKAALADISAARKDLRQLLGRGEAFADAAKRDEVAPNARPLLKRIVAGYDSMHTHVIRSMGGPEFRFQPLGMLAYFGDAEVRGKLIENAKGNEQEAAVEAAVALALCDWWKAAKDAAGQQKVLDSLGVLAHEHANDDRLAIALMMMGNTAPATPQMREAAMKVIVDDLKGPIAQQIARGIQADEKLKSLEGKPLTIAGKALDGADFTTANWKGKVILVDFWASWCGPCKAELPRVEKVYADYHAKGLEVIGISCDRGEGPLRQYLAQNPEMAWPQLFDAAHPGWHTLATGFGINGIPTMFLIDKAGVVRSVTARKDFEELIPKLLEEK